MSEPERFRDCAPLELDGGYIVAFTGAKDAKIFWLKISNHADMIAFTVPEARALYHWLGKVLPEEGG